MDTFSLTIPKQLQDAPELTYSEPRSSPEVDEWYLIDEIDPTDSFRQKGFHDELRWLDDLPEMEPDESRLLNGNIWFPPHSRPQSA